MRKKLIALLLTIAMMAVAGPLEAFATVEGDASAADNEQVITLEEEATTETPETMAAVKNFKALSGNKVVLLKWKKYEGDFDHYLIQRKLVKKYDMKKGKYIKYTDSKWKTVKNGSKVKASATQLKNKVAVDTTYKYRIYAVAVAADGTESKSEAATVNGEAVKTMYYKLTFKAGVTLTSHSGGSYKTTFKKGQTIIANGFDNGKYVFEWKCKDGKTRIYNAMKIRMKKASVTHLDNSRTYSKAEAELYVNSKGITSGTKYMIWVNLYSQKLYVFKGTKNKWKLVKGPWTVSTGRATMPTTSGKTAFRRKLSRQHGIPMWNVCDRFSIHGQQSWWKIDGVPRSGACVRNTNAHAKWIYNNCALRTGVYVY